MPKPRIQSRVDPHVKERVEEFAEGEGMTQAEAVRYLVTAGLTAETKTEPSDAVGGGGGSILERLADFKLVAGGLALQFLAVVFWLWAGTVPVPGRLTEALVLVVLGALTLFAALVLLLLAALSQIALARPLRGLVSPGGALERDPVSK